MKFTLTIEVPETLAIELQPFLERNPQLWLGSQSGCSKHGYIVLILRNTEERRGTPAELECALEQLAEVTSLIITGERIK